MEGEKDGALGEDERAVFALEVEEDLSWLARKHDE